MNYNITNKIEYIGVNDKTLDLFESQYNLPNGVSYNSYILKDKKTVVMDTVDKRVTNEWLENIETTLNKKNIDYLVISHLEPDHSANIQLLAQKYPEMKIILNQKAESMMKQFFDLDLSNRYVIVKEGDIIDTGEHKLQFFMAPMVHWPEVMVTYEQTEKILFSADGFGKFGTLDTEEDWINEARRYYFNIVGKYGTQVQQLLKKVVGLDIKMICPLHGPILKENLNYYINKYDTWSSYKPEDEGILVAYNSIHGNTKKAVEELEKMLKISNDKVRYNFDVSDDINKVLYGDKNKIKQLLLYINDYILERTKSKTMNIKVSNLSVGNLCRLKFSYFIDLSFEKYLIKDKKEIYIKEEKDDFDYRVILSMLRLLEGKINIKKENIISITITIDQKIKSEYDVNNYISSQDNYVNNQIKYTGKKIIIFNDSFEENQKIIELLKKYNLEISLCDNIEKLNKLITENNYDLVLVDDMFSENKVIPREEMLKQCSTKIIQRVNGTRIPVVIMVTKNNKSLEKKYLKYGYVDYIIKPLMDKDVSVILKKYLK